MLREEYKKFIFDTYDLVSVLANKNGCETLHIRHKMLHRDLVLHSFPKEYEAYAALMRIKCENLPEIYDCIKLEDGQIVLEEYIKGMSVAEAMEAQRYKYRDARDILTGVCNALSVLHGFGFVHRDVKPENVIISDDGRVVLIDFNASRKIKPFGGDTTIIGTVGYASPEQLGIVQTDTRTDIYALGIMLNVMITGKHPSEMLAGGKAGRIVKNCTNINPNDRYATVYDFIKAL